MKTISFYANDSTTPADAASRPGYVVAGFRGEFMSKDAASLVIVLAADQEAACNAALAADENFHPVGAVSEADLKKHYAALQELHLDEPRDSEATGFVVGGVRTDGSKTVECMYSVVALDQNDAFRLIHETVDTFQPAGCLKESEVKTYLNLIGKLRTVVNPSPVFL